MSNVKQFLANLQQKLRRLARARVFRVVAGVYLLAQLLIFIVLLITEKQYNEKTLSIIDDVLQHESQLLLANTNNISPTLNSIDPATKTSVIKIFILDHDTQEDLQWANKLPSGSVGIKNITIIRPNHIVSHATNIDVRYLIKNIDNQRKILLTHNLSPYKELSSIITTAWILARFIFLIATIGLVTYLVSLQFRQLDSIEEAIDAFERGEYSSRIPKFKVVTEVAKLALRLNEVLNHTEYLMKNTRQITNNIAHDLRKPLARIRNRLELLLLESNDPDHIRELEKSINDADNLLQTFNALLSISQAETGAHRDSFEKISLTEICTDMVDLYSAVAEDKNITITQTTDGPLPIKGSKQLITQLISNLLDNACKYINEGGEIQVIGKKSGEYIKLTIIDNGPGIPSGYHHKVLERFTRLDTARTAEGNGLGLSLAKAVITLHNARMEFKNGSPGLIVELTFVADKEQQNEARRNTRQL